MIHHLAMYGVAVFAFGTLVARRHETRWLLAFALALLALGALWVEWVTAFWPVESTFEVAVVAAFAVVALRFPLPPEGDGGCDAG